jgi:hypothetical protein
MFTSARSRGTRRAIALGLVILATLPVLAGIGRPNSAHAAAATVTAGFFNNSEYPIVQLSIDNQQIVPGLAASIPPQGTLRLGLTLGTHSYAAANGLNSGFTMYTFSGGMTVQSPGISRIAPCPGSFGQPVLKILLLNCTVFNNPSIAALLTRFGANGKWTSNLYFDRNDAPHANTFVFHANGTYDFAVDNRTLGSGVFKEVSRDPNTQTITFNVGGTLNGIFSETQGMFMMNYDPNGNALQYT